MGGRSCPRTPPRGENQSNGTVEEAGKTVREFVQLLREHVKDKAEVELGASDVIVLWMVRWAAMMVSRFLVGKEEWREGLWLGHSRRSNEAIIGTREGVVRAYAVKRIDEESRWDAKYLQEMKGTPQQPDPSRPGLAIPIKVNIDPPHESHQHQQKGRSMNMIVRSGACASRESCCRSTDTPRVATDVDTNEQECERHVHIPRYAVGGSGKR